MTFPITDNLQLLMDYLLKYGLNVLGALLTLAAGYVVAGWVRRLINGAMRRTGKIDPVFLYLPGKVARVAVLVFTLIALLGAAGLAIGLALQGTLSNVAAGVMILFFRPFKIGDTVQLSGQVYVIDSVGFFICKGHLPDGPVVFIPNSQIWGQTIVNLSVTDQDIRRLDETYGIAYDDDIEVALALLNQIALSEPRILKDPAPLIKVMSLGDNSVNILFRVWTTREDWWVTKLDLLQRCKVGLEQGGCSIPFPQRSVHIIQASG